MKKYVFLFLCLLIIPCVTTSAFEPPSGDPMKEPVVIRTTCYTANEGALCSTGQKPHYGTIAGPKEWGGMAVCLYAFEYVDGEPVPTEYIGLFTVQDTGAGIDTDGDGKGDTLITGQSIDVYVDSLDDAKAWVNKYGDYTLMMLIPEGD